MKPTSVLVVTPQGTVTRQVVSSLEDMQKIVGGYIELVSLPTVDCFVNEEGIGLDLDVNPVMSRFIKRELAKVGRILLSTDGWVLGTVLVIGKCDEHGDETDCPEIDVLF